MRETLIFHTRVIKNVEFRELFELLFWALIFILAVAIPSKGSK